MDKQTELVRLRCVKEGSKLRVRIISAGYNPRANCQFPRAIRAAGREYTCPAEDIKFAESSHHKFFYRVNKKNVIVVNDNNDNNLGNNNNNEELAVDLANLKIYGTDSKKCCVCMDENKDSIFHPCGHYYCCGTCANTLMIKRMPCPICRAKITQIVSHDQLQ